MLGSKNYLDGGALVSPLGLLLSLVELGVEYKCRMRVHCFFWLGLVVLVMGPDAISWSPLMHLPVATAAAAAVAEQIFATSSQRTSKGFHLQPAGPSCWWCKANLAKTLWWCSKSNEYLSLWPFCNIELASRTELFLASLAVVAAADAVAVATTKAAAKS